MKSNLKLSALVAALMLSMPVANAKASGVVKFQGKELVTKNDVDARMKELNIDSMQGEQVYMQVLIQLAEEKLMAKQIENSGLKSDPEFQRMAKLNAEEFARIFYIQKEARKRITPQMRQEIYDHIKESVKGKKEVNPKLIVVKDENLAKEIKNRLSKEKFEELAKTYSIDPASKDNGGTIGRFMPEHAFPPELSAELSKLQEGKVSNPIKIKTPNGETVYMIVLIEKGQRRDMQVPPIDTPEVANEIEQILIRKMAGVVQADLVRQLEVFDQKGDKFPLVPEQANQPGIPLIGGGVKK